jgi:hypothetical protein
MAEQLMIDFRVQHQSVDDRVDDVVHHSSGARHQQRIATDIAIDAANGQQQVKPAPFIATDDDLGAWWFEKPAEAADAQTK